MRRWVTWACVTRSRVELRDGGAPVLLQTVLQSIAGTGMTMAVELKVHCRCP